MIKSFLRSFIIIMKRWNHRDRSMVSGEEETEDEERICFGQFIFTVSVHLGISSILLLLLLSMMSWDNIARIFRLINPEWQQSFCTLIELLKYFPSMRALVCCSFFLADQSPLSTLSKGKVKNSFRKPGWSVAPSTQLLWALQIESLTAFNSLLKWIEFFVRVALGTK